MPVRDLSFRLHILTARLDRAADRILRAEESLSYARFLALFAIGELGASTQRVLAERLGVTEPSVSRMTNVLVDAGLIMAKPKEVVGNRHELRLTPAGRKIVQRCCHLLESHMAEFVSASGVPYAQYLAHTRRLVAALDADEDDQKERKR